LKTQLYEKSEKEPWLIEDSQKETQTQQKDQVLQFDSNISQKLVSETPFNGYFYYFFLFFIIIIIFIFILKTFFFY
jgi:t-SNARE complex subunit (syntaxin)